MTQVSQIPSDLNRPEITKAELDVLIKSLDRLNFDSGTTEIGSVFQKVLYAYTAYSTAGLNPSVMKRVNKFRSWLAKEKLEVRQALARRV
jgi:hypothetical protein